MEGCISALHAEAEACERQLAQQSTRAATAEKECAALKERLTASEAGLAACAVTHALQVGPLCRCRGS